MALVEGTAATVVTGTVWGLGALVAAPLVLPLARVALRTTGAVAHPLAKEVLKAGLRAWDVGAALTEQAVEATRTLVAEASIEAGGGQRGYQAAVATNGIKP
jgi:hypothetical protein